MSTYHRVLHSAQLWPPRSHERIKEQGRKASFTTPAQRTWRIKGRRPNFMAWHLGFLSRGTLLFPINTDSGPFFHGPMKTLFPVTMHLPRKHTFYDAASFGFRGEPRFIVPHSRRGRDGKDVEPGTWSFSSETYRDPNFRRVLQARFISLSRDPHSRSRNSEGSRVLATEAELQRKATERGIENERGDLGSNVSLDCTFSSDFKSDLNQVCLKCRSWKFYKKLSRVRENS